MLVDRTLINLDSARQSARRFDQATTAYHHAATIFGDTGDQHREARTLDHLGVSPTEVRRFEEAITAFQDAATIFGEAGDEHNERIALGNLEAARAAQSGRDS